MSDPYTIRIFVPDGNPEGVKIVDSLNWTGIGVAFPRSDWPSICKRSEFDNSGIYILVGAAEGTDDDLPTIYVGQGDEIRNRIQSHSNNKEFWDWGYAFVSRSNALNRAHITWLEYALLQRAASAERCHFDNSVQPREPGLAESELADIRGFLSQVLKVLPLLGVRVFEKPIPVVMDIGKRQRGNERPSFVDDRDTLVVPAQEEGFNRVFLGEDCWYSIRIGGGMLPRIKHIAAYQTAPTSAITHYAPVKSIEPYGDKGKYRLVFSEPATPLEKPISFVGAPTGSMQGPRYTNLNKLLSAQSFKELFPQ
jgi:hypothetical protein